VLSHRKLKPGGVSGTSRPAGMATYHAVNPLLAGLRRVRGRGGQRLPDARAGGIGPYRKCWAHVPPGRSLSCALPALWV